MTKYDFKHNICQPLTKNSMYIFLPRVSKVAHVFFAIFN